MATEDDLAFKGAKNTLKGKVRQIAGIVTDDESQQTQGELETMGGKLQSKASKAIRNAKNTLNGL